LFNSVAVVLKINNLIWYALIFIWFSWLSRC